MSPVFDEEAEMRKEEIEELIRLVEESEINELEISEGRKTIRISKGNTGFAMPVPAASHVPTPDPVTQPVENKHQPKMCRSASYLLSDWWESLRSDVETSRPRVVLSTHYRCGARRVGAHGGLRPARRGSNRDGNLHR